MPKLDRNKYPPEATRPNNWETCVATIPINSAASAAIRATRDYRASNKYARRREMLVTSLSRQLNDGHGMIVIMGDFSVHAQTDLHPPGLVKEYFT